MTQAPDVKERYVAAFKAFAGNGAGAAPPWLHEIREGAIARFTELGFPTMKQEEWRFTSVAPIAETRDRKSTRLNSSHLVISYAVFCLKKKKKTTRGCARL